MLSMDGWTHYVFRLFARNVTQIVIQDFSIMDTKGMGW